MNPEIDYENESLVETSQFVRLIRRIAVTIPPIFFVYLQFRGVDVKPLVSDLTAEWITKITLFLYYICWVIGSLFDIHKQEAIYITNPAVFQKKVKINTVFFAIFLTICFLILCWAGVDYKKLSVFLSVFWTINFIGWMVLRNLVKTPIEESYLFYKKNRRNASYFKLKLIDNYIRGNWQFYRFGVGMLFIAAFISLSYTYQSPLILSICFMSFVLIVEGWIFIYRFRLNASLGVPKIIKACGFQITEYEKKA